jgi:acyl dehydratase
VNLTIAELETTSGTDLGTSEWLVVDQDMIDRFADVTGDHQWIHVDRERAAAGPFGTTIAHGYLLMSLIPILMRDVLAISDRRQVINYGIDRLRFTSPVPAGARVRLQGSIAGTEKRGEGVLCRIAVELQIEGAERPALVGEVLHLAY